jgi:hypothetical protein
LAHSHPIEDFYGLATHAEPLADQGRRHTNAERSDRAGQQINVLLARQDFDEAEFICMVPL